MVCNECSTVKYIVSCRFYLVSDYSRENIGDKIKFAFGELAIAFKNHNFMGKESQPKVTDRKFHLLRALRFALERPTDALCLQRPDKVWPYFVRTTLEKDDGREGVKITQD